MDPVAEAKMQRFRTVLAIGVTLVITFASGCAPTPTPQATPNPTDAAQFPEFAASKFDRSAVIDNEWLPMKSGAKWVYEGKALDDEGKNVDRRIEFTVTDVTKKIQDVRTLITWIEDYDNGELVEKEISFYAQDKEGNVWYFGEHPEDYESGKFVAAFTWVAGLEDAKAGIVLMGQPKLGMPSIYQGWGPAVGWSDFGRVEQLGQETCVPVDCYRDVLVNAESSLGEEGAFQLKYYARGIGEIKVGWRGADPVKEELELVEYKQLNPDEMAQLRAKVLEVEKHAYEVTPAYRKTSPAEYPEGTPALDLPAILAALPTESSTSSQGSEVIVYASDLTQAALSELEFYDDPASPGGKWIGLPNSGQELDPPPEPDPHATFKVQVQSGIPYRCWIHMKVGAPKGASNANMIWVQLSDATDETKQEVLKPGSGSYLTAEGPVKEGWTWVECDRADSNVDSLVYFGISGQITVRLQAGAEGVGFDQFLLSPEEFLDTPPTSPIVEK
jgi:hypothetical protein